MPISIGVDSAHTKVDASANAHAIVATVGEQSPGKGEKVLATSAFACALV